jgi:RHS repeat-associated protein
MKETNIIKTQNNHLTYHYQKSAGKLVRNRLYHLNDAQTNAAAFADDIDNMLTFRSQADRLNVNNNYNYDEEGRLIKDSTEKITKIIWRVDGKVKEIQRNVAGKKWLRFDYDGMGNRIAKHVFSTNGTTLERSTYYILDAQGNQISTYDHEVVNNNVQFNLKERNIFGSSRIGSKQDSLNVLTATITQNYFQILGNKYFEFSNHLGNVLTVFSDLKIPKDTDNNNVVDGYDIGVVSIADYSPFGVELDGRTDSGGGYRYGFNGMEKDDEIKGEGNSVNYKYRMHDPRVGRFFAVDPLIQKYPYYSSYSFSGNRLIDATELEGAEPRIIHYKRLERSGKITEFSTGRAPNDNQKGCFTCAEEHYDFFFFKPLGSKNFKTYSENTIRGSSGQAWLDLRADNPAFFTALDIFDKLKRAEKVQIASDVLGLVVSAAAVYFSMGAASPLISTAGITSGVSGFGLNTSKLILDIQGKYGESSEIPSSVGEALGGVFDELYKKIESSYDGNIGASLGNLAEAVIGIGVHKAFKDFGVPDIISSSGIVASWISKNGKSSKEFKNYLKEFDSIMKEYKSIEKANKNDK